MNKYELIKLAKEGLSSINETTEYLSSDRDHDIHIAATLELGRRDLIRLIKELEKHDKLT